MAEFRDEDAATKAGMKYCVSNTESSYGDACAQYFRSFKRAEKYCSELEGDIIDLYHAQWRDQVAEMPEMERAHERGRFRDAVKIHDLKTGKDLSNDRSSRKYLNLDDIEMNGNAQ